MKVKSNSVRSIAMLDPIGDYGIGGYTYELSEGLAAQGVDVDVYTNARSVMLELAIPRHHRILPVLGGPLFRQRELLRGHSPPARRGEIPRSSAGPAGARSKLGSGLRRKVRGLVLSLELALHLKRTGYDLVWTQWPYLGGYGSGFWTLSRALGLRLVHTVHNVLPHETENRLQQKADCERVYRCASALIVHSESSRRELCQLFPRLANKIITAKHGLYTLYKRAPEARELVRSRLGIWPGQVAFLFFGSVRPYKNLDAVLRALRHESLRQAMLIVAGWDLGSLNGPLPDRLANTRGTARDLGVTNQVRFVPGPLDLEDTARVFEASDIIVLPYLKSYGSGLLLHGMTYQRHVVVTATGGMEEYLLHYPRHTLLSDASSDAVARGLAQAVAAVQCGARPAVPEIPELAWPEIARRTLTALEELHGS
jgi:beta-1,4-mannosyltransferase